MNTSGFQQSEYFRFSQGLDFLQTGVMVQLGVPPPPRVVWRRDILTFPLLWSLLWFRGGPRPRFYVLNLPVIQVPAVEADGETAVEVLQNLRLASPHRD